MDKYTVYFEIFGKKMKTTILAKDEGAAKRQVADKLIFHKIDRQKLSDPEQEVVDLLKDIFKMK